MPFITQRLKRQWCSAILPLFMIFLAILNSTVVASEKTNAKEKTSTPALTFGITKEDFASRYNAILQPIDASLAIGPFATFEDTGITKFITTLHGSAGLVGEIDKDSQQIKRVEITVIRADGDSFLSGLITATVAAQALTPDIDKTELELMIAPLISKAVDDIQETKVQSENKATIGNRNFLVTANPELGMIITITAVTP